MSGFERVCELETCGGTFTVRSRSYTTRFCSIECARVGQIRRGAQKGSWSEARRATTFDRVCVRCDAPFVARHNTAKYCSKSCRRDAYKARKPVPTTPSRIEAAEIAEEKRKLIEKTGGHCMICGKFVGQSLHRDHCHKSGKTRGVLCSNCNTGLGMFQDDVETLASAIKYLEMSTE